MSTPDKNQTRHRKIRRRLANIGVALAIVASILTIISVAIPIFLNLHIGLCSAVDKPNQTLPFSAIVVEEHDIHIPANILWDDTGITVQTGDWIEFTANGSWYSGISTTGPDGNCGGIFGLGRPTCGGCPVTDGNLGELIGKVGGGLPFGIGSSALQPINQAGSLLLAMNDNAGKCIDGRIGSCYDDNNGELDVKVSIKRIQTASTAQSALPVQPTVYAITGSPSTISSTTMPEARSLDAIQADTGKLIWQVNLTKLGDPIFTSGEPATAMNVVYVPVLIGLPTHFGYLFAFESRTGKLLWQWKQSQFNIDKITISIINETLIVAADIVFRGASVAGQSNFTSLFALNPKNGAQIWKKQFEKGSLLSDSTAFQDVIYGEVKRQSEGNQPTDGTLLAIKASDGSQIWQKHVSATLSGLVASNDAVFVGFNAPSTGLPEHILSGSITAFKSSDGSLLWSSQLKGSVSLEVMANGILFGKSFAPSLGTETELFALKSSDGSQLWRTSVADPLFDGYITADTNSVFATYPFPMGSSGDAHSAIYAFTAETGQQRWVDTLSPEPSPPVIGNGVVYIGVGYGYETYPGVWAIDPSNGNIKWTFRAEDQVLLRSLVST